MKAPNATLKCKTKSFYWANDGVYKFWNVCNYDWLNNFNVVYPIKGDFKFKNPFIRLLRLVWPNCARFGLLVDVVAGASTTGCWTSVAAAWCWILNENKMM